jgi:Rps23 Pro-64 3,4-dihydroxylase Tpa1-like proline 4-hydroxylase
MDLILLNPFGIVYKIKVITLELERAYLNAHTYGIEPHIHRDDGDVTLIYYPRLDWKIDWGGGTAIYNDEVTENRKTFC